ncbi:MAG: amino acid permease [Victivallales bacterium]|nr:amino acid permease [Victivallales bacterium]MCF7888822.1 amino acid permease [Victivallales bacterium]
MTQKNKEIGFWILLALVLGNIIGSGIFLLPSSLAKIGSISLVSWGFTCFGTICLALTLGKLSSILPKTGGMYAYNKEGFGDFIAFQCSLCYWIYVWAGNAAISIAGVGYLQYFFPGLTDPVFSAGMAILIIWIFTFINVGGVKEAGVVQVVTTVLKLIPIAIVVIFGWWYFDGSNIVNNVNLSQNPHRSDLSAISYAAMLTLWAFVGMESATIPAGEVKKEKKHMIARATIIGTLLVSVIYIATSTVIMGMIPMEQLQSSTAPFAKAAAIILGPIGASVVAIGAVISCLGAVNGWILLQGQIIFAAAEDGLFVGSNYFKVRNKSGSPARAIIFTSCLITGFLFLTMSKNLVNQFNLIITIATSFALIVYFFSCCSYFVISIKRSLKISIFEYIFTLLALAYTFWAVFSVGFKFIFYEMMIIFITFILYIFVNKIRAK